MAKSIDLAADPSLPASLLLSYILQYAPSLRLAGRAPRPRSSTDLAIRGPLANICVELLHEPRQQLAGWSGQDHVGVGRQRRRLRVHLDQ